MWCLSGSDIAVFDREHGEGVVGVIPWIVSRRLAHGLLKDVIVPFLFSVIFYFLAGFSADGVQFFKFYAVIFLNQLIAVTFATFCVAISRDFAIASLIGNLLYLIFLSVPRSSAKRPVLQIYIPNICCWVFHPGGYHPRICEVDQVGQLLRKV